VKPGLALLRIATVWRCGLPITNLSFAEIDPIRALAQWRRKMDCSQILRVSGD